MESNVMSLFREVICLFAIFLLLATSAYANSDSRIVQVWSCTLKEGKTVEDLKSIHTKWKTWANNQSYGGGIEARVATPIVSANMGAVLAIDVYPTMEAYAGDVKAFYASKEGQSLLNEYNAVAVCNSNALYSETDSE